jgi:hypothetical protein
LPPGTISSISSKPSGPSNPLGPWSLAISRPVPGCQSKPCELRRPPATTSGAATAVLAGAQREKLAIQRAGVLRERRLTGVAGAYVQPPVGTERDPARVVDRASANAIDKRGVEDQPRPGPAAALEPHPGRRREVQVDEAVGGKGGVDRQTEQAALAESADRHARNGAAAQAACACQQAHPAGPLRHQGAPVRPDRDVPRDLETGGGHFDAYAAGPRVGGRGGDRRGQQRRRDRQRAAAHCSLSGHTAMTRIRGAPRRQRRRSSDDDALLAYEDSSRRRSSLTRWTSR